VLAGLAREWNDGHKAPAYLPLYELFSSVGLGPHPDYELPAKWARGLSDEEHEEREGRYRSWRSHLRNRIALVRRALGSGSDFSISRRRTILGADPFIAIGERSRPGKWRPGC
jgi:hypothetical protein